MRNLILDQRMRFGGRGHRPRDAVEQFTTWNPRLRLGRNSATSS